MGISKKIKKRVTAKRAPLSLLDGLIYILFLLLILAIVFTPTLLFTLVLPNELIDNDPTIVAFDNDNSWQLLFCFPFSFILILLIFIPLAYIFNGDLPPIFGNPNYNPPARQPIIHADPIISKAFWKKIDRDTIDEIKKSSLGLIIALLITAPLLLLCLSPGQVMKIDHSLKTYNSFHQITHSAKIEEVDELQIEIYRASRHKRVSYDYGIEISFLFDDASYHFRLGDFNQMNTKEALQYLNDLKAIVPNTKCTIEHTDRMEQLLKDNHYSEEEIQLIYQLFEYTS